jgi:hypothetical protein
MDHGVLFVPKSQDYDLSIAILIGPIEPARFGELLLHHSNNNDYALPDFYDAQSVCFLSTCIRVPSRKTRSGHLKPWKSLPE